MVFIGYMGYNVSINCILGSILLVNTQGETMSNRNVSFVAVRVFSLYLFIMALSGLTVIVGMMPLAGLGSEATRMLLISFLPILFYVAIAAALWRFSEKISEHISAGSGSN